MGLLDFWLHVLYPKEVRWLHLHGVSAGEDVSAEHALVGGAITPADALRAVSERVDCCSLSLAKWLHRRAAPMHRRTPAGGT